MTFASCREIAVGLLKRSSHFGIHNNLLTPKPIQLRSLSLRSPAGSKLRYDGQTAVITGAGRGLGREYALLLASRGANVVVNDLANSTSEPSAELVVEEIEALLKNNASNKAVANHDSVSCEKGAQQLIDCAVKNFGSVDILINNAGILRDKSFGKLGVEDWDQVINVHLRGSFLVTRACWPVMRKQAEGGRIIMTSSTSGLYGNFGQANYAAAKMALIGLSHTLAIEGKRNKIYSNVIVPMALSRMTQDILPEDLASKLSPSYVAPIVAWLCHRECEITGAIFEAAGGCFGSYRLQRSKGKYLPTTQDSESCIETIADNIEEISKFTSTDPEIESFVDHISQLMKTLKQAGDTT